jgi:hypothetical protein
MDLDVVMIHGKDDNKAWAEQARASVLFHNVNIIDVDAVPGDTRLARKNGFEKSTAPYVSFVDPDDYVTTDIPIFELCVKVLVEDKSICGVSTRSYLISDKPTKLLNSTIKWDLIKHFYNITLIHQLTVMRTDVVQKVCSEHHDLIYPVKYNEHNRDLLLVQYGDWKIIPEIGYTWRKRAEGAHSLKIPKPKANYNTIADLIYKKRGLRIKK